MPPSESIGRGAVELLGFYPTGAFQRPCADTLPLCNDTIFVLTPLRSP